MAAARDAVATGLDAHLHQRYGGESRLVEILVEGDEPEAVGREAARQLLAGGAGELLGQSA